MKVCGFTFIRNAIKYDYPVVEAIASILPLCDKFVVAVGNSEDGTRELIEKICPEKIEIVDTVSSDESVWHIDRVIGRAVNHVLLVSLQRAYISERCASNILEGALRNITVGIGIILADVPVFYRFCQLVIQ